MRKFFFHKHSLWFWSLVLFYVIMIAVSVKNSSLPASAVDEYKLAGWLWSSNYGWISLNRGNTDATCTADNSDPLCYKVQVNSSNQISGWAWSSNVGWVCFGVTCNGSYGLLPVAAGGGSASASWNPVSGKISGWAKIISLDNDVPGENGWLKLGRGEGMSVTTKGEACYNCEAACEECESGTPPVNGICVLPDTCTKKSTTNYLNCQFCFTETLFDGPKPYPPGTAITTDSGRVCTGCGSPSQFCQKDNSIPPASRITCQSCNYCELYGAMRDNSDGSLYGWGWNGDTTKKIGAGWVRFNPPLGGAFVIYPWLETQFGSIYTTPKTGGGSAVRQKAGGGGDNATYCIFANNIQNVRSANCLASPVQDISINFPTQLGNEIYRNGLGRIDVKGLSTQVSGVRNKYGQEVEIANSSSYNWNGDKALNNKVYVFNGDLDISNPLKFINGTTYGNGLIVVNGNLTINYAIIYPDDSNAIPVNLKQLASAAWIVKGDVKIANSVKNVAGAFIVLGKDGVSCEVVTGSDATFPQYQDNSCGVFFSGASSNSLTVYGPVVAKAFDFRRTFAELQQGSERVIFDGRLTANPPPGLSGFAENLPVIRDFVY